MLAHACRLQKLRHTREQLAEQNELMEGVIRQLQQALANKQADVSTIRQNMDRAYQMLRWVWGFLIQALMCHVMVLGKEREH